MTAGGAPHDDGGMDWEIGVNGRAEDVLNRPKFIHNLINPAIKLSTNVLNVIQANTELHSFLICPEDFHISIAK